MLHFQFLHCVPFLRICNRPMVGLVINPVYWLISQQPAPIKYVRPPGIFGAISAIIIGYITSVSPLLRYPKVRAICSTPGIIYMRSLAPFGYILQYRITPKYIIHGNTRCKLVHMDIYVKYNTLKT